MMRSCCQSDKRLKSREILADKAGALSHAPNHVFRPDWQIANFLLIVNHWSMSNINATQAAEINNMVIIHISKISY